MNKEEPFVKINVYYLILILTIFKTILIFSIGDISVWEDHFIAHNLITSGEMYNVFEGVKSYADQFPLYPFIISIIYRLFGENTHYAALYNIILQALSAIIFYQLSLNFLQFLSLANLSNRIKERIAYFCSLIFVLYPPICWYGMYNVHPFSQNLLFLLLLIFLTFNYINLQRQKWFWLLCITAGFAVLDRNTLIVGIIPLFIWLLFHEKRKRFFVKSIYIFLLIFLIGFPWLLRNYAKTGQFSYTTKEGRALYIGAINELEGGLYLPTGLDYTYLLKKSEKDSISKLSAVEQDKFYWKKFNEEIRNSPVSYAMLYLKKIKTFWLFRDQIGNTYNPKMQWLIPVYKLFYIILFLLALIGVYISGKRGIYLFSVPIALSLIQSIFYVETRHRILIEPILIIFALLSIAKIIQKFKLNGHEQAEILKI